MFTVATSYPQANAIAAIGRAAAAVAGVGRYDAEASQSRSRYDLSPQIRFHFPSAWGATTNTLAIGSQDPPLDAMSH